MKTILFSALQPTVFGSSAKDKDTGSSASINQLSQKIDSLTEQRDVFVNHINQDIVATARQRDKLTGYETPLLLGQFKYRSMYGTPFGEKGLWEFMTHNQGDQSVEVLPIIRKPDASGQLKDHIVFITANVYPQDGKPCISLPGGFVGDERPETAAQAAVQECKEEVQYNPGNVEELGQCVQEPFSTRSTMHFFLAEQLSPLQEDMRSEGEKAMQMQRIEIPVDQVYEWLDRKQKEGFVVNGVVYSALALYENHKNKTRVPSASSN